MAVTANWYGLGVSSQWGSAPVNFASDTIKVALTTSSYTPNQDTHNFFSDVTNELAASGGYSTGGVTLGTKNVGYDTASNEARLTAANSSWSSASFTTRNAIIYKSTGTNSTSLLMGYVQFGGDQTVSSGTFTIQWDATGVLKVTAA
jgi:hypothetical protein